MDLNQLWFLLIAVLFVGFFVLEGFDFGVGTVAKFLGKDDVERRVYISAIGPYWDANEVWLITAGGAMFAAFPHWYATMFSGFYIPLVFMLIVLILRGVGFEFRGQLENMKWRKTWDWSIFVGSAIPPILWGVVLANFMIGMPIDADMEMQSGFLFFLNPFALLGGIMFLSLTTTHGLQFLTLRTTGELQERARKVGKAIAPVTLVLVLGFALWAMIKTDIFVYHGTAWIILPILAWIALLLSTIFNVRKQDKIAFTLTSVTIILLISSVFIGMYPRVLISSIADANSLTIYDAASGAYTLKLMTYFSLTLLPFVLGYTAWSYYVFRKRVSKDDEMEY